MSDIVIPAVACGCLGGSLFLSVACYSLRNFSRSRLAQLCRERGNEDRFGEILRQDADVLLSVELLLVVLLSAGMLLLGLILPGSVRGVGASPWRVVLELFLFVVAVFVGYTAIPRSLSVVAGEAFLYRTWPVLRSLSRLMSPLRSVAVAVNTFLHRLTGKQVQENNRVDAFAEEIQSVVHEGEREGVVETRHGRMIQRVMELHEQDVQAVMTPRTDIIFLTTGATLDEARRVILESGHSRIPLIGKTPDDIVGILYARDLLQHVRGDDEAVPLSSIAREPVFIPETTSIETLMETMKRDQNHIAIVLDEYGGVTGLVTMEDLLEEIVGEIEDEFDEKQTEKIQEIDPSTIEVDARVHLDDLNELYNYDLPESDDFDTIGGFVFSELGRIPRSGDEFRWKWLVFTILEADKRRIIKLRIHHNRNAVETVESL